MVTRLKTWVLLGHSNAEGVAGSSPMVATAPWLAVEASPDKAVYKNILVFTAANAWPDASGTPPTSTPGQGAWLAMTTNPVTSPGSKHPHPAPYHYPNTRGRPGTPEAMGAQTTGGGSLVGVEVPYSWRLSQHYQEKIGLVKLAIPGSLFLRYDKGENPATQFVRTGGAFLPYGTPSPQHYAWWTPQHNFDFSPGTERLYASWFQKMVGAAAALVGTDTPKMDVRHVVLWVGDNDATLGGDRIVGFIEHMRRFVARIRSDLVTNDWTTLPAHQIPVTLMGVHAVYYTVGNAGSMNTDMQSLVADDPWLRWVPTDGLELLSTAGYVDLVLGTGSHFSHNGYLAAEKLIYESFVDMETAGWDALGTEDRITFKQAKERLSIYYERNRVRTDASDTVMGVHLNGAMLHVVNTVGDGCWWLRYMTLMALNGTPGVPVSLPKIVSRLLRIEHASGQGYPLYSEMLGFSDGGRMQVLLKEGWAGTFMVHYIRQPKEMTRDEELVPLPLQLVEWLIVEAARRMARAAGNIPLQASLSNEVVQLMKAGMDNAGHVQRAKRDKLSGARRIPTRNNLMMRFQPPYVP